MKNRFFFTYGTDEIFPYHGGWSVVYADSFVQACQVFKLVHPNPKGETFVNCAGIYTEEQFYKTSMSEKDSNLGHGCWEIIDLQVVKMEDDDDESQI